MRTRTIRLPRRGLGTMVVLAWCALTACSGEHQLEGAAELFSIAMPADPGPLDPHHAATYAPAFMLPFAYESLITHHDGLVRPLLARDWKASPTSVTFTLRDEVTCADGSPLTVNDVADNFRYIADPANRSVLLGSGVPFDTQIEVNLEQRSLTLTSPVAQSFLLLQTGSIPIVCRSGLEDRSRLAHGTHGTGLFQLSFMLANDHYTFTRRKGYTWGSNGTTSSTSGVPSTVTFRVIANPTTAANLLLSGEITAAAVHGPDRSRLDEAGFSAFTSRSPAIQMWFNHASARPTADEDLRRALAMAIDVSQIRRVAGGHWGLQPRRLAGADPMACSQETTSDVSPAPDPDRARALLERLGWRLGPDGVRYKGAQRLSLSLVYDRELIDPVFGAAAAELAAMQWKAAGAEVRARPIAGALVSEVLFGSSDYDISWIPIIVSLPSRLMVFTSGATPPHGTNFPHASFAGVTQLAQQANQLAGDQSCPLWNEIERTYLEAVSVIPVFDSDNAVYSKGATFALNGINLLPTSIRLKQ